MNYAAIKALNDQRVPFVPRDKHGSGHGHGDITSWAKSAHRPVVPQGVIRLAKPVRCRVTRLANVRPVVVAKEEPHAPAGFVPPPKGAKAPEFGEGVIAAAIDAKLEIAARFARLYGYAS